MTPETAAPGDPADRSGGQLDEPASHSGLPAGAGAPRLVGHPGVDVALNRLREVETLEGGEQVAIYGDIHHSLEQILRSIDAA